MDSHGSQHGTVGTRDCGTFFLDIVGNFAPEDIIVNWQDTPRQTNDHVEAIIEKSWKTQLEKASQENMHIYDGKMSRLITYKIDGQKLYLTAGPVSYREFIGTNATHAYIRYVHGLEVLADPIGVSAAVCTNDDYIVMGVRSRSVAQYQNRIHPIGGTIEDQGASVDPFKTMTDELFEETSIDRRMITKKSCIGLVRDRYTVQPELIFDYFIDCEMATVFEMAGGAKDYHEHSKLVAIKNHPASVVNFIEQKFSDLTPIALATFLLHGLQHWGSGWFANARGYLHKVI